MYLLGSFPVTRIIIISATTTQGHEHVPFDKADEVFEGAHGLGRPPVVILAERGVERDVDTVVENPDGVLAGLLPVLPELKDQPGREPREPGFGKAQGTENRGQSDVVSRGESKELLLPALRRAPHAAHGLVQDGVGAQERVAQIQFLLLPLSLVLYLMPLDHLEVLHVNTAVPGAGEADVVAEEAEHGVYGVGGPELLGGRVHDPGHLLVGPLQLPVFQTQQVLPTLLLFQVLVPQRAIAVPRAEQSAGLVPEINLLPVKIWEKAIKQSQPTLQRPAFASGLQVKLLCGPVMGQESVFLQIDVPQQLAILQMLHNP